MKKIFGTIVLAAAVACSLVCVQGTRINSEAIGAEDFKIINVTDENRDEVYATPIAAGVEETYHPDDRRWNGIAHIEVTTGGRLFASWYTGGAQEPDNNNYMVLSYSDNGGKSWVDPFLIVDTKQDSVRAFDPFLHINNAGELVWYWWCGGNWKTTIPNPDAAPADISWTKPEKTGPENIGAYIQEPVRLSDGSLAVCRQNSYTGKDIDFLVSDDDGKTWKKRGSAISQVDQDSSEAKVLELSDGTLWLFTRIPRGGNGGVQRFVSTDSGWTWSEPQSDLGKPFIGPGSRFAVGRLLSGNLLFVTNDSTSARTALTAWLSEDDGKTWPYSLLIDDRSDVAYPEFDQDAEGNIYLVYDKGRRVEKEIRLSVFNEQDIKDGVISSSKGASRLPIAKDKKYSDIVYADTGVAGSRLDLPLGTSKEEAIAKFNTTVAVTDEKGIETTLTGTWNVLGYSPDREGTYVFNFRYEKGDLPEGVTDSRGLLSVRVKLGNKKAEEKPNESPAGGCNASSYNAAAVMGSLVLGIAAAALTTVKRRKKD